MAQLVERGHVRAMWVAPQRSLDMVFLRKEWIHSTQRWLRCLGYSLMSFSVVWIFIVEKNGRGKAVALGRAD